jgi:lysophospholipase L1-like esterase
MKLIMNKKIVCIGNSITNGFPFKRSQSFPSLIRAAKGFEVINKGANGETTDQVLARFTHDVLDHKPDMVTILTGTNDFIFGLDTPQGAFEKIKEMVRLAQDQNIIIILMTPLLTNPEMAKSAWMTGGEIDYLRANDQLKELGRLIREYHAHDVQDVQDVQDTHDEGDENDTHKIIILDLQKLYQEYEALVGSENAFHDGLHPTIGGQGFISENLLKVFPF